MRNRFTLILILSILFSQDRDLLGDLNQDGVVDILDIVRTVFIILELPPEPTEYELWASDINEDGATNVQDIIIMVDVVINPPLWYSLGLEDKVIFDLELYPPYLYACAGQDGLWRLNTEVEDSEWQYLGMSFEDVGSTEGSGVIDMVANYDNPEMILVIFIGNDAASVYKTIDDGVTWIPSDGGISGGNPSVLTQTASKVYLGNNSLFSSENFGDSWEFIYIMGMYTYSIHIPHSSPNIIWAGGIDGWGDARLRKSNDFGLNWFTYNLWDEGVYDHCCPIYSIVSDPLNSEIVFVSLSNSIIKTVDGGENWISELLTYNSGIGLLEADETQSGHLFTGVNKTVMKTVDGGLNWTDLQFTNEIPIKAITYDEENDALYIGRWGSGTPGGVFVYK